MTDTDSTLKIKVEFGGGLELLFSNKREHDILVPRKVSLDNSTKEREADLGYLISHLRDTLLTERPELFMDRNTVRPGILVLVNDTDWELEGEGTYILRDGDEVVFISTLHGG